MSGTQVVYTWNDLGQFDLIVRRVLDSAAWVEVVTTDYSYDSAHRLTDLEHRQGGTTLAAYEYGYDAASRVISTVSPDGTSDFTYDAFGQLESADHSWTADEDYQYDETGNRSGTGYVTDANNRLTESPDFEYEYDDEGNRTKRTAGDGTWVEYSWDHRNRLTGVVFKSSLGATTKQVAYAYDAQDRRIGKLLDAAGDGTFETTERYHYDGGDVQVITGNGGAVTHRYLHGPDVDQVFADESTVGEILWPLADRAGSIRDVADYDFTTNLTSIPGGHHRTFDSFGTPLAAITDGVLYAFAGREFDTDTGLSQNHHRWYDPAEGRFLSEDPLGFAAGDANLNRYVFNNPLSYTDPSGLSWLSKAIRKVTKEVGRVVDDVFGDRAARHFNKLAEFQEDVRREFNDFTHDVGDFYQEQWENGNIQKALLVATVIASAGIAAPLMTGAALTWGTAVGALGVVSGGVNIYETFTGDQIGDGTLSRVLNTATIVTGGIAGAAGATAAGSRLGASIHYARAGVGGYEAATGRTIGDGTLGNVLYAAHLGVNVRTGLKSEHADVRFSSRMELATGAASFVNTGDPGLRNALRSASAVWSVASSIQTAKNGFQQAAILHAQNQEASRSAPVIRAQSPGSGQILQASYETTSANSSSGGRAAPRVMPQLSPWLDALSLESDSPWITGDSFGMDTTSWDIDSMTVSGRDPGQLSLRIGIDGEFSVPYTVGNRFYGKAGRIHVPPFHRLRVPYLDAYQRLVLLEPDSAVDQPLKEAFLSLRQSAESDE